MTDEKPVMTQAIEAHGFVAVDGILEPRAVERTLAVLASSRLPRSRAGVRHAMRNPSVAALTRDPRLIGFVRSVLGPEAVPFRATLFDKSPSANWLVVWHQDTALPLRQRHDAPGWGPWSRKAGVIYAHAPTSALSRILALRIHLDDSTAYNGPLRVLPGTHQRGVLTDEEIRQLASEVSPVDCVVSRGGVLVMRPLLIHSSSKSRVDAPRRVLHIEYVASMDPADGLELAVA